MKVCLRQKIRRGIEDENIEQDTIISIKLNGDLR
jgi:hypothetical protein